MAKSSHSISTSRDSKRQRKSQSSSDGDEKEAPTTTTANQAHADQELQSSSASLKRKEEVELRQVAAEATVVEFDSRTGLPVHHHDFLPEGVFDPIRGIVRRRLPRTLLAKLRRIHAHIQRNVDATKRVPWSGLDDGDDKARAFGFMGPQALHRLDHQSAVRLAAPEKEGQDAIEDEAANRQAICILDIEEKNREEDLDIVGTTNELVEILNPTVARLDSRTVCTQELIAYQINMHNGTRYLPAHLDWPLHEGFGKVIVTVAIKGDATVLLISGDTVVVGGDELQPAWRFHLQEGECYVLSDRARNRCLHAVIANDDNKARESLNLRFGLHTEQEAEEQITRFWEDAL